MSGQFEQAVETFAQAVASGRTQSEAYRRSHPRNHSKGEAIAVKACAFAKRPEVVARVAELRARAAERAQMTRDELVGMLTEEIRQCYADNRTLAPVMKQVDCLTRVCGYDRQTLDVKAEVGAADPEAVAEKVGWILARNRATAGAEQDGRRRRG